MCFNVYFHLTWMSMGSESTLLIVSIKRMQEYVKEGLVQITARVGSCI